jgi:amino acid transporter
MGVYVAVVFKLAGSATPEMLAEDPLVMARIASWAPMIFIGLGCATVSSAIGSILVAPRTLQALAADGVAPVAIINDILRRGGGAKNEPRNATIVTALIALPFVASGNVDFGARIISMFFMVTYGALCAISFLEHFAARPSYRPSFRSKWYVSITGGLMCLFLMFQMDPLYALASLLVMIGLYRMIERARGASDLSAILQAVMSQMTRHLQLRLQRTRRVGGRGEWRPSIVMVGVRTFSRTAPLQFLGWLCQRFGFGTYLHFLQGTLDVEHFKASRREQARLLALADSLGGSVYVDTIVSPSIATALAQSLQIPGVSGMENNTTLFEFSTHDGSEVLREVHDGSRMATAARMNSLVLRHGDHFFGGRAEVHLWLTWHDYRNANLMILLAYILLGHRDWEDAELRVFAAFPQTEVAERRRGLKEMIDGGRLPITEKNLRIIGTDDHVDYNKLVELRSAGADLVICGFTDERMRDKGPDLFLRHPGLRDVLWVQAQQQLLID